MEKTATKEVDQASTDLNTDTKIMAFGEGGHLLKNLFLTGLAFALGRIGRSMLGL